MAKFPKNQIKYILKSRWDESKDLEKAILNYFYNNKKEVSLKKTDDLILLYILGVSNKAKKQFFAKFDSWKKSKDAELANELIKLFFLSSINGKNSFKKEIVAFLNITSENDLTVGMRPIYLFLKKNYLNEDISSSNLESDIVLSLVASLLIYYEHNKVKQFYETQIKLFDLIEKEKLSIYDKIGLLLFSENNKFEGIQLNRKDSLEYLRSNNYEFFYNFIKNKFETVFFKQYKLWIVPSIFGILTILNWFNLIEFLQEYVWGIAKIRIFSWIPALLNSTPNLLILFLVSLVITLVIKIVLFLKELKKQ